MKGLSSRGETAKGDKGHFNPENPSVLPSSNVEGYNKKENKMLL